MTTDDPRNIFVNQHNGYNDGTQSQQSGQTQNGEKSQNSQSGANSQDYNQKLDEMKRLAEKYQKEGESQLVKDIVRNVLEQKASGRLTNEQLQTFASRVMPLLNTEQKQRLTALMNELLKL